MEAEVLVRAIAERVARSSGLDLVDVEMKRGGSGPLVRVYLDKPGRISLEDLESASREISAILDVEDPIGRSYTLEVSSPGMTRPLKTPRDFERVLDKTIQIAFVDPPDEASWDQGSPVGAVGPATETRSSTSAVRPPAGVRELKGRVLAVSEKEVRIVPRDNKGREGAEIAVAFSAVRHAQREISFR